MRRMWLTEHDHEPDEPTAHNAVVLPRELFTRPDVPLVNITNSRVSRVPPFSTVGRAAMVRNLAAGKGLNYSR